MKKIVSVVLLMMCMMTVHAQLYVTPEAGMLASKPHWSEGWSSGWKAGAGIEYRFKSAFALKTGAYYMKRSYELPYMIILDKGTTTLTESGGQTKNHFLQIPLLAKFGWKVADGVRMHFAFGPYMALSLANTGESYYTIIDYEKLGDMGSYINMGGMHGYGYLGYYGNGSGGYGSQAPTGNDNPIIYNTTGTPTKWGTEWGATATFGVDINRLSINLNYDASLGDSDVGRFFGVPFHTLSLTVGYSFQLTK